MMRGEERRKGREERNEDEEEGAEGGVCFEKAKSQTTPQKATVKQALSYSQISIR